MDTEPVVFLTSCRDAPISVAVWLGVTAVTTSRSVFDSSFCVCYEPNSQLSDLSLLVFANGYLKFELVEANQASESVTTIAAKTGFPLVYHSVLMTKTTL